MDRITKQNLERRIENLNRRMESRDSLYRYQVEHHSGLTALYRTNVNGTYVVGHITSGTKREIGEHLSMMMIVLDDASMTAETNPLLAREAPWRDDDEPEGAGADPAGRPDPITHPEYWSE